MSLPLGWWSWFSINMIHWLAPSLVLAAICLAVVRNAEHRWLLPLAALLLTFDMALVTAPHVGIFSRFAWNWQGKLLESAWPLLLGATGTLYSLRTIGFAAPRRDSWPGVLVAAALALAFASAVNFAGPMRMPVDAETAWFESTLPGWSEELLFRGVLLWATNEVFGRPWRFAGAQVGWGWIITTLLFATMHLTLVDHQLHLHLSWMGFATAAFAGAVLGWVRERSGSLWPGMVLHNLIDMTAVAAGVFG